MKCVVFLLICVRVTVQCVRVVEPSSLASCIADVLWNSGSRLVLWYRVVPVQSFINLVCWNFQVVYKCQLYVENRISGLSNYDIV